jgi:membrane associated rhomboid family serine protease
MNPNLITRSDRKPHGAGQTFPKVPTLACGACLVIWLVALGSQGPIMRDTALGKWMVFRAGHFDLTSFLVHPFFHENWIHLLVNVAAIWFAGWTLEERWGSWRFLLFYLASGLLGGLAVYLVGLSRQQSGAAIPEGYAYGASAVALACLTAYSVGVEDRPALGYLSRRYLIWTVMILGCAALVFLRLTPQTLGIAVGAGLYCAAPRWWNQSGGGRTKRQALPREKVSTLRLQVDQLLEKISRQGMQSLSRQEKSFLRNASKHFRNQGG